MNICSTFCTAPVSTMITDQIVIVMATSCLRDIRSDSDDIGMAPSTNSTPVAPPIAPRTASEMFKRLLDVGGQHVEHAAVHELDHAEQADDRERASTADAHRLAERHGLVADTGELGVGEQRLRHDRRVGLPDVLLEHGRGERGDVAGCRVGLIGLAHRVSSAIRRRGRWWASHRRPV